MVPGTILFDDNFKFSDGQVGHKLFIVLNDGTCGFFLGLKTTSNGDYHGISAGCQISMRYPSYYIPRGSCWFREHTWVQLEEFFLFDSAALQNSIVNGRIKKMAILETATLIDLLECASQSEDLESDHLSIIIDTIFLIR